MKNIEIKGARANNLKNIDLSVPRNKFTVITGVSGSGKSSLAFDTLYAEGRRRYVESLSSYARQFLGRMPKPEVDSIKGLPPAIAIEQKVVARNPRSTVGTSTEIYEYMRLLFARIGHTISPISGQEVKKDSIESIVKELMSYKSGTRMAIVAPIIIPDDRTFEQQLDIYLKEGYTRLEHKGSFEEITDIIAQKAPITPEYYNLLIDRISISDEPTLKTRITDSIETAYFEGHDSCIVKVWTDDGIKDLYFSKKFSLDGIDFREPSDLMFNFNNPYGACPTCEGFGQILGISEDLVVPDKTLSIFQDAIQCWKGEKMKVWKFHLISNAQDLDFPIHCPYMDLTKEQLDVLWHGKGSWQGIDGFFRWVDENQYKIQYRVMKARYRGKTLCPDCNGGRLRSDAQYVKINGKSIGELVKMQVVDLLHYFENIVLSDEEILIASRLLTEIKNRLRFMYEAGLGYLTLDRLSSTLSGGESQRIRLATSLGSPLVGSLYVLDEPSIGLHPADTNRLINIMHRLRDTGNTLVVVEHDEDIMRASDYIVDIGPDAGSLGGEVVFAGNTNDINNATAPRSKTIKYLNGEKKINVPTLRRPWKKHIKINCAQENNLKNITVDIPLGIMTVITGVSGSGKSTLVKNILYPALSRHFDKVADKPGKFKDLTGDLNSISDVQLIDQNPIGTSTRSNAATYLKIYDEIRNLFAGTAYARQMGFTPTYFSFNSEGGRCEECKGEGTITIPMQFMADIQVPCEVCGGKRFKHEILETKWHGKNIADILDMTVAQAADFFSAYQDDAQAVKIVQKLQPLLNVGLGYIPIGQSSSTLSGGENQRLKLALHLSNQSSNKATLFIFDEPTTGLHTEDISTLLEAMRQLVDKGHTVVIIEHNLHVIKCADWIIDLGPGGGDAGGNLVAAGTPETIAKNKASLTGKYLKPLLKL